MEKSGIFQRDRGKMENEAKLNLTNIPWPISILKCNQRISEMLSGERLLVILKDVDTKDNLTMLLNAASDFTFETLFTEGTYILTILKRDTF